MLVCPGDHYSLSELPHAQVTGSILATALALYNRVLFPEFPRPTRTFSQRRAVEKLSRGVHVFLHSKRGNSILCSGSTIHSQAPQETSGPYKYCRFTTWVERSNTQKNNFSNDTESRV